MDSDSLNEKDGIINEMKTRFNKTKSAENIIHDENTTRAKVRLTLEF